MSRFCSILFLTTTICAASAQAKTLRHCLERPSGPATGAAYAIPAVPVRVRAKVLKTVRAKHTPAALKAHIEGKVIVFLTIDADGTAKKVKLIKGLGYGLDEAALKAVQKWTFSPATVDGTPIQSTKRIKVDFVIEE